MNKIIKGAFGATILTGIVGTSLSLNNVEAAGNTRKLSVSEIQEVMNSDHYTTAFKFYKNGYTYYMKEDLNSIVEKNTGDYQGLHVKADPYVDISLSLSSFKNFETSFAVGSGYSINAEVGFEIWGCGASVGVGREVDVTVEWTTAKTSTHSYEIHLPDGATSGDWYLYDVDYVADYVCYCVDSNNRVISGFEVKNHEGVRNNFQFLQKKPLAKGQVWIKC